MREIGRRKITGWAAAIVLVVLAVVWWQSRAVEVSGRVGLRSWDGAVTVPQPARAMLVPRRQAVDFLRRGMVEWPAARAAAEARREEARVDWEGRVAARDEALRILRVAERANAADLAECRLRFEEAERAENETYAKLEQRTGAAERADDPALLVAQLPGAADAGEIGADGRLFLRSTVWQSPVLVVLAGEGEAAQAWLVPADAAWGGTVDVELSNANLITAEGLRALTGIAGEG